MNINESIRDWVFSRYPSFPDLAVIDLVTCGETADLGPPFLAIYETGSQTVVQDGVTMHGVSEYEITVELHTVPAEQDELGTPVASDQSFRRQFTDILLDRSAIAWIGHRNGWTVFDIRASSPTTEANEGRRISRWILTVIACPN